MSEILVAAFCAFGHDVQKREGERYIEIYRWN